MTICKLCDEKLKREEFNSFLSRCEICHYPKMGPQYKCSNCNRQWSIPIYSLSDYSGTYSKAILEKFKFLNDKSLARLVSSFFEKGLSILDSQKTAVLVPVPCSSVSLKKRGWDQMREVVKHIDRISVNAVVNISHSGIQQKNLTKDERAEFALRKYELNPKLKEKDLYLLKTHKVIIVDDIVTTKETVYAVASILKDAGISDISAVSWLCEL